MWKVWDVHGSLHPCLDAILELERGLGPVCVEVSHQPWGQAWLLCALGP